MGKPCNKLIPMNYVVPPMMGYLPQQNKPDVATPSHDAQGIKIFKMDFSMASSVIYATNDACNLNQLLWH